MKSVEFLFFDYGSKEIVVVKIIFLYLTATMTLVGKNPKVLLFQLANTGN